MFNVDIARNSQFKVLGGDMAITVKNINGTPASKCKCGSWLDHWDKFSGLQTGTCRVVGCNTSAEVGAHVQRAGSSDWYIIPVCKTHNACTEVLKVNDLTTFISANVQETCAKKI